MKRFKKIARYEGISQAKMAAYLGVSKQVFSLWVNEKRGRISIDNALKLQRKFFPEYTIEELFGE